jgi:L-alanine-DL-glutamate epimerase-like enolase superfamily enzyme
MPKITKVRTIRLEQRPKLLWVEVETDDGRVGLGETFRGATAAEAVIHEVAGAQVLGKDARDITAIADVMGAPYVGYHSASAEIRAASAIDIALWDLHGQRHGIPVFEALGGAARRSIPVYNTCAGYDYNTSGAGRRVIGGSDTVTGPYDDQVAFERDAASLAESLLAEGYKAMKIWPFDRFATGDSANHLSTEQIQQGLQPFKDIRERVGNKIEVMCELHSLWNATTALRICQALEPYDIFWVEDPISKMDDAHTLADIRRRTRVPICASETLSGLPAFRELLAADAVDYVMLDLVWCGGFTGARKIAALAEAYARPLAPHDCTGPIALFAGLHLALHARTAIFQEVVRASLSTWYGELLTALPVIEDGRVLAPSAPGIGAALRPEVKTRPDCKIRESVLA